LTLQTPDPIGPRLIAGQRRNNGGMQMNTERAAPTLGARLREWRNRRRMSQLELACDADISARHLSFLETGRAKPSQAVLLHLAMCLDVPLRDRNTLLRAAGFEPIFQERAFDNPALGMVRQDVEAMLSSYDPNPALAVDRHWTMLTANRAVAHLVAGAEPMLLRPPVNLLRLFLHPAGLASRIVNLAQWRGHVFARLRRQIDINGDPVLMDLLEEIRDYPGLLAHGAPHTVPDTIAVPFRLATIDGVLSFFSTSTVFQAPVDITVSELAIEAFLPADTMTAEAMRGVAAQTEAYPKIHAVEPLGATQQPIAV
jgi:transcriptional regulator with XRE-family HTH domain